jgi:hypothetical protein
MEVEIMKLHEQHEHHEHHDQCEEPVDESKCVMREVRKLEDDGRQISIVTTNQIITIEVIASNMFARWGQEIFFSYMRQDFAIDKIVQYSVDEIDKDFTVVNHEYNNITKQIQKERDKLGRKEAKLYEFQEKNPLLEDDEKENKKWMKQNLQLLEEIQKVKQQITELVNKRKDIPYKITIDQMPEAIRYNRLNKESKTLMNVLKMTCFRAETAFANLLKPHFQRAHQEIRMLIKSVINTPVNLKVDTVNHALNITLFTLSNQRSNEAISKICSKLNETNTVYPDTNLKMIFKITTI